MAIKADGSNPDILPSVDLQIEYVIPDGIETRFASNYTVQQTDGGFYLSFFENILPIFNGPAEEFDRLAKDIGKIKSMCVARIFLPASKAEGFLDAFTAQLNAHIEMNESGRQPSAPKRKRS